MGTPRPGYVALGLCLSTAALLLLGLCVGSTGWEWPAGAGTDMVRQQILWDIRLPRTLGAWLAGTLLGLSGAIAQGLFRNPLADPYLLGSASGAALGAAGAMVLVTYSLPATAWVQQLGATGLAFLGSAAAVLLTLALAKGVQNSLRLLLAGVVVGVVLGAMRDLLELNYPDVLQPMKAFGLGSTVLLGWSSCWTMAAVVVVSVAGTWGCSRVLDAMTLGESTAASLGLPLVAMRLGLIAIMALATGAAVAQVGLIAFVGLAAPHLLRSLVRTGYQWGSVLSGVMGGVLLLTADIAARWCLAPQELPVGLLTALFGGSYLLWLMYRGQVVRQGGG